MAHTQEVQHGYVRYFQKMHSVEHRLKLVSQCRIILKVPWLSPRVLSAKIGSHSHQCGYNTNNIISSQFTSCVTSSSPNIWPFSPQNSLRIFESIKLHRIFGSESKATIEMELTNDWALYIWASMWYAITFIRIFVQNRLPTCQHVGSNNQPTPQQEMYVPHQGLNPGFLRFRRLSGHKIDGRAVGGVEPAIIAPKNGWVVILCCVKMGIIELIVSSTADSINLIINPEMQCLELNVLLENCSKGLRCMCDPLKVTWVICAKVCAYIVWHFNGERYANYVHLDRFTALLLEWWWGARVLEINLQANAYGALVTDEFLDPLLWMVKINPRDDNEVNELD